MSRSSDTGYGRRLLAVATALAVLIVLYSVFILGQLLLGVLVAMSVIGPLVGLYLLYRLVLAHERIATALESRADARRDDEHR